MASAQNSIDQHYEIPYLPDKISNSRSRNRLCKEINFTALLFFACNCIESTALESNLSTDRISQVTAQPTDEFRRLFEAWRREINSQIPEGFIKFEFMGFV